MARARRSSTRFFSLSVAFVFGSGTAAMADVLSITNTGPPGVKAGDAIAYAITVLNAGPGDLANVVLDDPTPTGLGLVSVSGDCSAFQTCTFATLASGATKMVTVTFSVPVAYTGPNPIVNTAVAHTGTADAITATASTAVTRVAGFSTLPPCRIVDTRGTPGVPLGGPAFAARELRTMNVRDACGLPGNAIAISYNLTVTGPNADGDLRIFPGGSDQPPSSSAINYSFSQTRANNGIVRLAGDGSLSVLSDQGTGKTDAILDVNGYFTLTDAVATPAGLNVHIRPAPEAAITFDTVTQVGSSTAQVLEFADNRSGAVNQDLRLFFPPGSPERALVPSVVVPSFITPLGKGGPGGPPTFVLTIIGTTAKFARTAEFHGFEDFRLGWNPPCVVAAVPTQEPRTFYAREAAKGEPSLVEETAFGGPVFVDISSGCGSNKGSGWNFSLYLTAKDTRSPHDIALYMLQRMQDALSTTLAGFITDSGVATQLGNQVAAATSTLDSNPTGSLADMINFIVIVDANPGAFDNSGRNVSGELLGRALSARYMIQKLVGGGTWASHPSLPVPRFTPVGVVANHLFYLVSGIDSGPTVRLESFNPGSERWASLASLPRPHTLAAGAALNGKIYVLSGHTSGNVPITDVDAYDPATNTWASVAPLPAPRAWFAAATVNGILYAVGGGETGDPPLGSVDAYDPSTGVWSPRPPLPTPRSALTAVELGGKLYAIGGGDLAGPSTAVEVYDPGTNAWTATTPLPTRTGFLAAAVINGLIYVVGGTGLLQVYNPATNAWATLASMPTPRGEVAVGALDGRLWVAGGLLGSTPDTVTDAFEAFTPP